LPARRGTDAKSAGRSQHLRAALSHRVKSPIVASKALELYALKERCHANMKDVFARGMAARDTFMHAPFCWIPDPASRCNQWEILDMPGQMAAHCRGQAHLRVRWNLLHSCANLVEVFGKRELHVAVGVQQTKVRV
jgi:hypothetical protein